MATVRMPSSVQARNTRMAISPRLAHMILVKRLGAGGGGMCLIVLRLRRSTVTRRELASLARPPLSPHLERHEPNDRHRPNTVRPGRAAGRRPGVRPARPAAATRPGWARRPGGRDLRVQPAQAMPRADRLLRERRLREAGREHRATGGVRY